MTVSPKEDKTILMILQSAPCSVSSAGNSTWRAVGLQMNNSEAPEAPATPCMTASTNGAPQFSPQSPAGDTDLIPGQEAKVPRSGQHRQIKNKKVTLKKILKSQRKNTECLRNKISSFNYSVLAKAHWAGPGDPGGPSESALLVPFRMGLTRRLQASSQGC